MQGVGVFIAVGGGCTHGVLLAATARVARGMGVSRRTRAAGVAVLPPSPVGYSFKATDVTAASRLARHRVVTIIFMLFIILLS